MRGQRDEHRPPAPSPPDTKPTGQHRAGVSHPPSAAQPPTDAAVTTGNHLSSIKNKEINSFFMTQCIKCLASAGSLNLACLVNLMGCQERGHDLKPQVIFLLGRLDN